MGIEALASRTWLRWMSVLPPPSLFVPLVALVVAVACAAPAMRSTVAGSPSPAEMAEFWNPPPPPDSRDLLYGVGGRASAPDPQAIYTFDEESHHGFSRKMKVRDPSGRKWDVKFEPEAEPEVVSSRIVWALGYHQPPDYYLPVWALERDGKRVDMPPARFRPHDDRIKKEGTWSWHANPFVDTQPFRGLIVLMMILNNSDLKDDNNALYDLTQPFEHASRWYVVKDLGATLGETGPTAGPSGHNSAVRGDPAAFEHDAFVAGVKGDRVLFTFNGRHQELLSVVRPEDVVWMCKRLEAFTPAEWQAVFRAGGYNDEQITRFLAKIREKIAKGKALERGTQP